MSETRTIDQQFDGADAEPCTGPRRQRRRAARRDHLPDGDGGHRLELGFAERLVGAWLFGAGRRPVRPPLHARPSARRRFAAMNALARRPRGACATACWRCSARRSRSDEIDDERIAAIGFCFGGQCALDLARSGAEIAGVASFHGLFDPPGLPPQPIKAKVAAYHGWDDPMVPPEAVVALGKELTAAGADWQIHAYRPCRPRLHQPRRDRRASPASTMTRRRRGAAGRRATLSSPNASDDGLCRAAARGECVGDRASCR